MTLEIALDYSTVSINASREIMARHTLMRSIVGGNVAVASDFSVIQRSKYKVPILRYSKRALPGARRVDDAAFRACDAPRWRVLR